MNRFSIEFDGSCYVVTDNRSLTAMFATIEEAYEARRDFEEKRPVAADQKIPPAMRWAIANFSQVSAA